MDVFKNSIPRSSEVVADSGIAEGFDLAEWASKNAFTKGFTETQLDEGCSQTDYSEGAKDILTVVGRVPTTRIDA